MTLQEYALKRIAIWLAGLSLVLIAAAYYSFPQLFKEPLLQANRSLSGLDEYQVRVGSHDVHYLEGGQGEPVVLLHGIFAEKDHWVDFARPLTDSYRVIAPDLPGFGESDRHQNESYAYAEQVERLHSLLDALGIARAHIAGSSMGGTLAALFAVKYPDRVFSVGLIGAPHGIRSPQASDMDRLINTGGMPLVARNREEFDRMMGLVFAKRPFLPYPILHAAETAAIQNASSNVRIWEGQLKDRYLLQEHIAELPDRTLVLWGAQDRIFDISGADILKQRAPRAKLHVLPDAGHLPMMEVPSEAAQIYARFLNE